ncbi:MAG: NAD(P)-binding protein [Thermoleophilia bacterium]|nr:NAD(P)-binding protein [Thermoleophilia bacterium]
MPDAVVVGSGPGGCTAAMVLSLAGWDVTVLEKGRNHYGDLTSPTPATEYANDELKMRRGFGRADPEHEPRTFRWRADQDEPLHVGHVNTIPGAVGGGTSLWDAKVPRLWDIDFAKRSLLGPADGADVVDWPFSYEELAPWYDAAETLLGAAGDLDALPSLVRDHAPRSRSHPVCRCDRRCCSRTGPGGWACTRTRSWRRSTPRPTTGARRASIAVTARCSAARSTTVAAR